MRPWVTAICFIASLLLPSCTLLVPPPPTPTATLAPTETVPPPTVTPRPSPTAKPSPTDTPEAGFLLPLPGSPPTDAWRGIRIMPGAIAGDELQSGGYVFTTLAPIEEIEKYYVQEMPAQGWGYVATGTTDTGGLFIIFDQGASVSVLPVGDEAGTNYVMIILP